MNPVARFPRRVPKTASFGLVSMIALAHASPAAAQDACGPAPDGGTVVCEATDPPYTSIRYTDRLDELGAAPSVGSRGDAYDCEQNRGRCSFSV